MPSPVGHCLAALTVHALTVRRRDELLDVRRLAVSVGAAVAPDLDLLLRFVDGRNHHQAESHSLGFALLASGGRPAAGALATLAGGRAAGPAGGRGAGPATSRSTTWGATRTRPSASWPSWPLSSGYFKFPWPLFMDIGRTLDWETVRHNAVAVAWEAVLLVPPLLLCWRRRLREGAG